MHRCALLGSIATHKPHHTALLCITCHDVTSNEVHHITSYLITLHDVGYGSGARDGHPAALWVCGGDLLRADGAQQGAGGEENQVRVPGSARGACCSFLILTHRITSHCFNYHTAAHETIMFLAHYSFGRLSPTA